MRMACQRNSCQRTTPITCNATCIEVVLLFYGCFQCTMFLWVQCTCFCLWMIRGTNQRLVSDNLDFQGYIRYLSHLTPHSEREAPPRFPQMGSLEYDVAMRWKAFFEQEKTERNEMEERIKTMKGAIQKDMDTIKEQHQTIMLRQGTYIHCIVNTGWLFWWCQSSERATFARYVTCMSYYGSHTHFSLSLPLSIPPSFSLSLSFSLSSLTHTEIARHQMEQQRLAERLREQEERLKGLQAGGSGLLPMFGQLPQPLFPPLPGSAPDGSSAEVSFYQLALDKIW